MLKFCLSVPLCSVLASRETRQGDAVSSVRILEASVCLSSQVENGSGSEDIDRDN